MSVAVILAGGKSRRMGRDKLSLQIDGLSMLESAAERFSAAFEQVYLSVADEKKYPDVILPRILDIFPDAGPMSGLHAALSTLSAPGVFLVAADLPFSSPEAALKIIELCGEHEACVVRLPNGKLEPLFGYYKSSLLGACENALEAGNYKMTALLPQDTTRFVEVSELGDLWSERLIKNINYPEDYEKLHG